MAAQFDSVYVCLSLGYDARPMSASTLGSGEVTPRMMVLGLAIQQAGTVADVDRRLADQFPSERFSRGSAHKNLPSLAKKGYVRLLKKGPPGRPTLDWYEATPKGIEFFRRWVCDPDLPPAIRDVLQCKLEFLEPEDLPALIQLVGEEEKAYTVAYDIAQTSTLREQRLRRARGKPVRWRTRVLGIKTKDKAKLWGLMSQRLEHLREDLEELLDEVSSGVFDGG
jgi:DNA-binding PadR family transcriptional regulator